LFLAAWFSAVTAGEPAIDFERARQLLQQQRLGGTLTAEEHEYVQRAREARQKSMAAKARMPGRPARLEPRSSTGLVPLCDMSAEDRYQGEDGGLYGGGRNSPPDGHRRAADRVLAQTTNRGSSLAG